MGVRTNDHQRVGGKQYFEHDAQFESISAPGGVDLIPNGIATTLQGLNPTWRLNFGGATLAAASNTTDAHLLDKLTPVNTLFQMSLALAGVANQGTVTAAQAGQIFGATSNAGVSFDLSSATTATNVIPATLTVSTLTGTLGASLTLADSDTDLASDLDQALIVFGKDCKIAASAVFKICFNAANQMLRASTEFVCTGTGTDVLTRQGQSTDDHRDIILTETAGAEATILPGSFIYMQAGANTGEMAVKGCIRTTGGYIVTTYAA